MPLQTNYKEHCSALSFSNFSILPVVAAFIILAAALLLGGGEGQASWWLLLLWGGQPVPSSITRWLSEIWQATANHGYDVRPDARMGSVDIASPASSLGAIDCDGEHVHLPLAVSPINQ